MFLLLFICAFSIKITQKKHLNIHFSISNTTFRNKQKLKSNTGKVTGSENLSYVGNTYHQLLWLFKILNHYIKDFQSLIMWRSRLLTPGTISAFPSSLHSATFELICSLTSDLISPVSPAN